MDPPRSEAFLGVFTKHWMGRAQFEPVLPKLAESLRKNHGDMWMADFLNSRPPMKGVSDLQSAIWANERGDPEKGERDARAAERHFRRARNSAGQARSRYELLFALHRQARAAECSRRSRELAAFLQGKGYSWLEIQNLIEAGICAEMGNRFAQAGELIRQAREMAQRFQYPGLQLRALGKDASFQDDRGALLQAWQSDEAGLAIYWQASTPYAPEYGQQLFSDLESLAEKAGNWHVALAFQREAVSVLAESWHIELKASAHFKLATLNEEVGDGKVAQDELELANGFFHQLPQNAATALYEANVEINLAGLEAATGMADLAQKHLNRVRAVESMDTFTIQLPYWATKAEIERIRGNPMREEEYLRSAATIAGRGLRFLHSERERWHWKREVKQVYRRLLELETERPHDPVQAWSDWQSFRYAETRGALAGSKADDVQSKQRLLERIARMQNAAVVSFAVLPHSVKAWVAGANGIQEFQLSADPEDLRNEVEVFLRLCSNPDTSLKEVRNYGRRLYDWLFAPVEITLGARALLMIDADDFLSRLPWRATLAPSGEYLGDKYEIESIPGLFYLRTEPSNPAHEEKVLVVAPGAVTFGHSFLAPLPEAEVEARNIAELYPNSTVLKGRNADSQQLLKWLPEVTIFHFAGHAISRDSGGELLLSGSSGGETLSSAGLHPRQLRRCKLVVLSACSTAADEQDVVGNPEGLVRAFLTAGAMRVVASRWNVDSQATAEIMSRFHRSLHDGRTPARALKNATQELRLQANMLHPYYWASFEVFGASVAPGKQQGALVSGSLNSAH